MFYVYEVNEWQVHNFYLGFIFLFFKDQLLSNVIRSEQVWANLLHFREYWISSEIANSKQIGSF